MILELFANQNKKMKLMVLNSTQIRQLTGHKAPLNLLDRVDRIVLEKKIVGIKNVSSNEIYFQGHFPANPVMPGVLIIETCMEAAQVLFKDKGQIKFKQIRKARFRQMVRPGDQLVIEVDRKDMSDLSCETKALLNNTERDFSYGCS